MEQQTDYRALYEAANDLLHVERQQVKELNSMLADAQATIAALQADNRTYINERHENMKQIEQLQAMNNRLGVRVETLQSQLTQRTAEIEAANKLLYKKNCALGRAETIINDLQAELERVRGERDVWYARYNELSGVKDRQLNDLQAELERVRALVKAYADAKTDFDDKRLQEDHHAWRERYNKLVEAENALLQHRQGMEG